MGIEAVCCVRFGDVKIDNNVLQICHDSYQPAATDKPTETIDLTSDNSGGFYLGASYGGGRPLDGYIAEARVWYRALIQSEIANNMNYVDPASEGLLAYWRMNEWEPRTGGGNIVKDLTGHGYDAQEHHPIL